MRNKTRQQESRRQVGPMVWLRRGFLGILGVLLVLILVKGISIGLLGVRLYQEAEGINQAAEAGLTGGMPTIQSHLQTMETLFGSLENQLRPLDPVLNRLDGWTRLGSTLAHTDDLAQVGRELTQMAQQGAALTAPVLASEEVPSLTTGLASALVRSPEGFQILANQAEALTPQLEALQQADLLPILAEPLGQGAAYMGMGAALLKIGPSLANLMGAEKPATYLLLIQNNHELRATGGFLTAVGQVTVDQGEIGEINFRDSYEIANHEVDHPWAPDPMRRFLGLDLMFLRDANWSPDLPTAAQLIRTIYAQDEGIMVDGIITIDLRAIELLIDGIGPLRIPDVGPALTGENIIAQIKEFWQQAPTGETQTGDGIEEWWQHRKDFMPVLGEAAIQRIQGGAVDYVALVEALHTALEERAVQIWVNEPAAAKQLAQLGWDGGLRPPPEGDFLALVDSNFGYNKVDSVLKRVLTYQVSWPNGAGEAALATTTVHYTHPVIVPGHQCDLTPRYGITYDEMTERCYFDYVRLYVPAGSRLLDVAGVDLTTTTSQPGENGSQVFAAYFIAEPGTEHQISFQYELPARIEPSGYRLLVRRQAGSGPLPITAQIGEETIQAHIVNGLYAWP